MKVLRVAGFFAINSAMRLGGRLVLIAGACVLTACASGPGTPYNNPADPFEPFNRKVSVFNDAIDDNVLKPAARAYRQVVPSPARTGVNNFFTNLSEPWNFVNSVLQLKPRRSVETLTRFLLNTGMGLGGVLDIASETGIEYHNEDFGQTLGRWGVPPGPYLVLPLFGPSTVRDTAAFPINRLGEPLNAVGDTGTLIGLSVLRVVDLRSNFLRASRLLEDAALDKYSFARDAHLQRRRSEVYDGNPPAEDR
ncbi:MAG: VacJ family lipoprotein [Variovorax sp.]